MHEASVVRDLVGRALAAADGSPVQAVHVRIGALAAESADALCTHFDVATAGTALAGARLVVTQGTDAADPAALGVALTAVDVTEEDR